MLQKWHKNVNSGIIFLIIIPASPDIRVTAVKSPIYRETQCHIFKIYLINNECNVIFAASKSKKIISL